MDLDTAIVSVTLASGVALFALGMTALVRPRSRVPGGLAFGLLAACWGIQIVLTQLGSSMQGGVAETLFLLGVSFVLLVPFFLVMFTRRMAEATMPRTAWQVVTGTVVVAAVAAVALLFAAPHLLYRGVLEGPHAAIPDWGPAVPLLITLPLALSFGLSLVLMERARRAAISPRVARRLFFLVVGFALYTAYSAASNLVIFIAVFAAAPDAPGATHVTIFGLLVGALLWLIATAVRDAHLGDGERARLSRAAAVAMGVPLALGLVEGWIAVSWLPDLNLVGLARIGGVAALAVGVEVWRSDSLISRLSAAARRWSGATAAVVTGSVTYGLIATATTGVAIPLAGAAAGAAAGFLPVHSWVGRLARRRAAALDAAERRYDERIETYRAALEMSLSRASLEEDARFLASLRERLGISRDEDRLLMHLARKTVVPIRRHGAAAAYERLRLLGEGGNGRTWLARDRRYDRLVVLKEPLERWQQEEAVAQVVLREARLAAKVRHPNIVRIHEVVEDRGRPLIVMDYLPGGTLADRLQEEGVLEWRRARDILLGVLAGVAAIHAAGVVHRDIKPSNILFDDDDGPHLADFGIAIPSGSGRTVLVDEPRPAGTRGYMAPEVAFGRSNGDRRADLYACGVLLHHCIHGAPPGLNAVHFIPDRVPPALQAVIERAIRADPEDRYPDAASFVADLQKIGT